MTGEQDDQEAHCGSKGHVHSGVGRRDKLDLQQRLNRIEGQVRGIRRMVDEDRYCPEVLTQIAAVRAALDRVGLILLEDHTRGCIVDAVREGHPDEAMTELMGVLRKFLP